jgi:hypothetical protein
MRPLHCEGCLKAVMSASNCCVFQIRCVIAVYCAAIGETAVGGAGGGAAAEARSAAAVVSAMHLPPLLLGWDVLETGSKRLGVPGGAASLQRAAVALVLSALVPASIIGGSTNYRRSRSPS